MTGFGLLCVCCCCVGTPKDFVIVSDFFFLEKENAWPDIFLHLGRSEGVGGVVHRRRTTT